LTTGCTSSDGGILYECDLCGGKFQLLEFLKHADVHADDLPYACDNRKCDLKFKTLSQLRQHRRSSHKVRILSYDRELQRQQ
jgi:hypothetical protein